MQHLQSSPGEEVLHWEDRSRSAAPGALHALGKASLLPKCLSFPIGKIRTKKYPSR